MHNLLKLSYAERSPLHLELKIMLLPTQNHSSFQLHEFDFTTALVHLQSL